MVRANTTLTALCVLVLGVACTAPTPEEPARQAPKATRRALGEGPASLVVDVGASAEPALVRYPEWLTVAGSTLLLSATDDSTGPELWRLDPTGPALVADISPGPIGSAPSRLFHSRGLTWFAATDPEHGVELWRTDGTTTGTFLLKDIAPGTASSRPSSFAELNGWIFFSAYDGVHGTELWRTDGTPDGTQLVRDISLGVGSSEPQSFTELGGSLYFLANGPGGTRQLWRTDGTGAGTVRVGASVTVAGIPASRVLVRLGPDALLRGQRQHGGQRAVEDRWHRGGHRPRQGHPPGHGGLRARAAHGLRGRGVLRRHGRRVGPRAVEDRRHRGGHRPRPGARLRKQHPGEARRARPHQHAPLLHDEGHEPHRERALRDGRHGRGHLEAGGLQGRGRQGPPPDDGPWEHALLHRVRAGRGP